MYGNGRVAYVLADIKSIMTKYAVLLQFSRQPHSFLRFLNNQEEMVNIIYPNFVETAVVYGGKESTST
jgi:hypothetical protein